MAKYRDLRNPSILRQARHATSRRTTASQPGSSELADERTCVTASSTCFASTTCAHACGNSRAVDRGQADADERFAALGAVDVQAGRRAAANEAHAGRGLRA